MSARQLFCLSGVSTYTEQEDLDGVPDELRTMRKALTRLGLTELASFTEDERGHGDLQRELLTWASRGEATEDDQETLLIYCTGHGVIADQSRFRLVESDGRLFAPQELLTALAERRTLRQVVLILDTCNAGQGVDAALSSAREPLTNTAQRMEFWAIASSRRLETAAQRTFASAFAKALQRNSKPSWAVGHFEPAHLVKEIEGALRSGQSVWLVGAHSPPGCRVLPNPCHQSSSLPVELPITSNWAAAARGVSAADKPGYFFTGRAREMRMLREHIAGEGTATTIVVTGAIGSGKSALLGNLVLTAVGSAALTTEARLRWPALSVRVLTGRGTRNSVVRQLARQLDRPDATVAEVESALRESPKPIAVVLDQLVEEDGESWDDILALAAVPGVRLAVGLPPRSELLMRAGHPVIDLDETDADIDADVGGYLATRFRLVHQDESESTLRNLVANAERWGPGFAVAVAGCDAYAEARASQARSAAERTAKRAATAAARKICRAILFADLAENAGSVVDALSALCSFDESIAVPAHEWAAVASKSSGAPITAEAVTAAAAQLGRYVRCEKGSQGADRWRTTFHPYGSSDRKRRSADMKPAEHFLALLPQLTDPSRVEWDTVDPSVLRLVAWGLSLQTGSGRLLDDPGFLLSAPAGLVSAAVRKLTDGADRTRRSLVAGIVSEEGSLADRALLLDIASHRFGLAAVATAVRTRCRPAHEVGWVHPARPRTSRFARFTTDAAGTIAITLDDNDVLEFWNPKDGGAVRSPVRLSGVPCAISAARLADSTVALVSTWDGDVWSIPCDNEAEPVRTPDLVPLASTAAPPGELHVALHRSGRVLVGSGSRVWSSEIASGLPARRAVALESELHSILVAGSVDDPVGWLVTSTGRVRRLRLAPLSESQVAHFPVSPRPLFTAAAPGGDAILIIDIGGGLHLRGAEGESERLGGERTPNIRAAAADSRMVVVGGGPTGGRGWLQIHHRDGSQRVLDVPLDEPPIGLAVLDSGDLLVARPSGLLTMASTPWELDRPADTGLEEWAR
ncbi:AAA ATPase domain [Nocardia amikacinitolerans]|uniref:ATP-binding protein n=1 Tax=Nocardia amikacinitolerans TaxID=756689 RepID=UPI0020A30551|nr:ATP-binding protein [Nocardia amikacinitolerans]MCP2298707.1 AAA ATPase domain [Nocardia amikacinitolerans]